MHQFITFRPSLLLVAAFKVPKIENLTCCMNSGNIMSAHVGVEGGQDVALQKPSEIQKRKL